MSTLAPRPELPAAAPWSMPAAERWALPEGTGGRHLPAPRSRMLDVAVHFPSRLSTERRDVEGVTALMGALLVEATETLDAEAFGAARDRNAASLWNAVDLDGLTVHLSVPASRAEEGLDLLVDALSAPAFAIVDIERLATLRISDIHMERAQPGSRAHTTMDAILYAADERASRPVGGSEDEVRRIDRDAIVTRYLEVVVPSAAIVVSSGPLATADVRRMIGTRWHRAMGVRASASAAVPPERAAARTVLVDRPGSPQAHLLLAGATIDRRDPDWPAALVASNVLGEGLRSRLNHELREQKGYTYGAGSGFHAGRAGGIFTIEMSVQADVAGVALADTLRIVRDLRADGPTTEEHFRAVESIVSQAPIRLETPEDLVRTVLIGVGSDLSHDWFGEILRGVAATTPASVREAFDRILPETLSVVVVADRATCAPQLAAAGIVPDQEM